MKNGWKADMKYAERGHEPDAKRAQNRRNAGTN